MTFLHDISTLEKAKATPDNFLVFSVLTSGQSEDDLLTVNGQSWSLSLFQENLLGQMLVIKVRECLSVKYKGATCLSE
jgi:hypothetical protein